MTQEEMKQRILELEFKARKMESLLARCAGRIGEGPIVEEIAQLIFPLTTKTKF